jgi:hypothetical protein
LVKGLPASPLLQVLGARLSGGKRSHRSNHYHFFGWFRFDPVHVHPLACLLPPPVSVKANHAQCLTLHTSLGLLASEMGEPAPDSEIVVNRLPDVLLVQMLRAHIASWEHLCNKDASERCCSNPSMKTWQRLGRSNHSPRHAACPDQRSLRSSKDLVGEAPPEYLTNWRMH